MADTTPAEKSFSYADVSSHATKKDLYVVIHDKVYNSSSFVDEHPGGEEVLLDVAGQDASEAFEDVGHSDEAREILDGMLVGVIKRQPGDPAPKVSAPQSNMSGTISSSSDGASMGVGLYAILLLGAAAAYAGYTYLQNQQGGHKA